MKASRDLWAGVTGFVLGLMAAALFRALTVVFCLGLVAVSLFGWPPRLAARRGKKPNA